MRKSYFLFDHADAPQSALPAILKILSAVSAVVLIATAVYYSNRVKKECCLCSSFRYHAPCLVDLETGKLVELNLYFPHETKVAELADPQPKTSTFSFVNLGSVTGIKLTDCQTTEIDVPVSEKVTNPSLCKICRKQLDGLLLDRYVLADLYDRENKTIIPIQGGLHLDLRCYEITAKKEEDTIKVTIQGTLEASRPAL